MKATVVVIAATRRKQPISLMPTFTFFMPAPIPLYSERLSCLRLIETICHFPKNNCEIMVLKSHSAEGASFLELLTLTGPSWLPRHPLSFPDAMTS